jgi:hypothetical protein
MADNLTDLEQIRATLIGLRQLVADKRTPSGARRRAAAALGDCAVKAIDLAMARLRGQQTASEREGDELV